MKGLNVRIFKQSVERLGKQLDLFGISLISSVICIKSKMRAVRESRYAHDLVGSERGDVPGWVLVVLMTTGLVTAIWTIAAPRLTAILRNSLDSMNGIR